MDHCGSLPYFTEICGYNGPVIMTYPTKAICPVLLHDFRKVQVMDRRNTNSIITSGTGSTTTGSTNSSNVNKEQQDKMYTDQDIKNSMKKGIVADISMLFIQKSLFLL